MPVETAQQHMYSFLIHHHLIDEDNMIQATRPAKITFYESIRAIKPHAGFEFLIRDIKTGTMLSKGQKFARDDLGDHLAQQDCCVVVPSLVVWPTDVDAGFLGRQSVLEGNALLRA